MTPGLAQWVKDPLLLWLWCRPASAALILPLVWELPYAMGTAPKGEKNVYVRAQNQDGRVVRCGTQLFPLYIKNTSAHGTVFTEHLLNTSGRPQTRTRKISMGREKGKKKKKRKRDGARPPGRELKERRVSCTLESPIISGEISRDRRGASEAQRREQQLVCGRQETLYIDIPCDHLAYSSLRLLSASRGGGWVLELGVWWTGPGKELVLTAW